MDLLGFVVTVILLTASGALAPGPLFVQTIAQGARTGARSGLIFSLAHTLVEFSLIMLLAFGLLAVRNEGVLRNSIGVLGGCVLILFGAYQLLGSLRKKQLEQKPAAAPAHRLFFIGVLFTALNPYFIVWWLTVGSTLIFMALELAALAGVIFMFLCHVWMDYVWLTAVSYLAKRGVNALGSTWYRVLIGVFGVILIYFGMTFLGDVLWW
ncbi:MAG: LysE family transporter [Candidatus Thermoplasmatota archaeon]|nr:LysE family transporter [Candidatus Thermoplasmatota archaeon]